MIIHIDSDCTLEMGYQKITLDKLFGALSFCQIRVWADSKTCEWVVEREVINKSGGCSWEEMIRIDGQESLYIGDSY